jgi:hypothetical protein
MRGNREEWRGLKRISSLHTAMLYNNKVSPPPEAARIPHALNAGYRGQHCSIGTARDKTDNRPNTVTEFIPLFPPHLDPPPSAALGVGTL